MSTKRTWKNPLPMWLHAFRDAGDVSFCWNASLAVSATMPVPLYKEERPAEVCSLSERATLCGGRCWKYLDDAKGV